MFTTSRKISTLRLVVYVHSSDFFFLHNFERSISASGPIKYVPLVAIFQTIYCFAENPTLNFSDIRTSIEQYIGIYRKKGSEIATYLVLILFRHKCSCQHCSMYAAYFVLSLQQVLI